MIKIRIKNADHEIDVRFPISENELYAKLAEIHAIEEKDAPQSAFVTEVYWPEEFSMLKDRFANLDELNYLAKRMESFDYHEYDQFLIGITKLQNPTEKDLINLTFNLDHFTLCKDVSSYGKIGREYVMNTQGAVPANDEDDPKYAAIGKELIDKGLAQITGKGLLIYNPFDELTEVYDGQTFPEYYYENTLASAEVSYNGRTELLLLPGEELAIQKALARLGAPSDSDCEIKFCLNQGEDDACVVKGTLMNKATGKPVTVNDEPVTAEAAFTPESRDGEVKVSFTFNSYVITETTDVVVFESLYREDVEIAVHADIEDEGQSVKVYVPEIKTTASIDGKKEITTAGKVTIEDVVSYTNLIPGTEYTIRGTLMNKATGEVFTVNGETITAEVKFTPENRNGEVKVTFTFDAHDLTTSTKVVVFEGLYREDVEITTHKDIEDKDQTVTITPPPDVPQTGDNSNLGVWIGLGGVALGGAIACVIMYFKKKKDDGEK